MAWCSCVQSRAGLERAMATTSLSADTSPSALLKAIPTARALLVLAAFVAFALLIGAARWLPGKRPV